jgi:hypothetical protein
MTVQEAIERLKTMPPDAEVGQWRSSMGVLNFYNLDTIEANVVKAQVFVGTGFGRSSFILPVKDITPDMFPEK